MSQARYHIFESPLGWVGMVRETGGTEAAVAEADG